MEGIERIKQKILQEAQNEKEKIIDEAKEKLKPYFNRERLSVKK